MDGRRARILVVEDEPALARALAAGLRQRGFDPDTAGDGAQALARIDARRPDAVVLDIGLPDTDGIALLPRIRARTDAPVLMLTARVDLVDKLGALGAGADDYVAKPFEFDELAARLCAHLRRRPPQDARGYAGVLLDAGARIATRDGHDLGLSPREFDLLAALLREQGRVFRREQLVERVWGHDAGIGTETVDRFVSLLRAKLEARGPRLLQTVRGVGFVLRQAAP